MTTKNHPTAPTAHVATVATVAPSMLHARICKRPKPVTRTSWRGTPELWCPSCGRTTPLPAAPDDEPPRAA